MKRERWSGRVLSSEPRGVAQFHREIRTLPEGILRLAQAEYEYQYGTSQDYERMQERGGLSVNEVIGLLADYVERLGGTPTSPREKSI